MEGLIHGGAYFRNFTGSLFKLIEVLVSISDCQDLISRVPIKKIFISFGLSARDVLNNLFRYENKIL